MVFKKAIALTAASVLLAGSFALPAAAFEDTPYEAAESCSNDTFYYYKYENHVEISRLSTNDIPQKLVIPETIDGLPVTVIREMAFQDDKEITEIVIPDSVHDVGIYAFLGTAWYDNQPDGIVYAGNVAYCYKGWDRPEELRLREGTTAIASWSFGEGSGSVYPADRYYCTTPVIIPKSVKYISTTFDSGYGFSPFLHPGNLYYEGTKEEWEQIEITDDTGRYTNKQAFYNAHHIYYETTEASNEPSFANVADPGDVTLDGVVSIVDVITLNRHLMVGEYLYDLQKQAADIDGNGTPDEADALRILKGIVEIEPLPEPPVPDVDPKDKYYQYGMYINLDEEMIAAINNAELSPHLEYDIYEGTRENGKVYQHIKLRDADIATLDAFAEANFSERNTPAEKLYVTHQWIHYNNDYAYVGEKWNTIVAKTYVDAIFNYRLGQCIQYNGAMAGMLAYMGYNVWMEGTPGVHWTTYVELDGKVYNIECGNHGKNGGWQWFFSLEEDR